MHAIQLLCHFDRAVRVLVQAVVRALLVNVDEAEQFGSCRHIWQAVLELVSRLKLVLCDCALARRHLLVQQRVPIYGQIRGEILNENELTFK